MNECEHKLVPVVYGYMYGDTLNRIDNNEIIYGGSKKSSGSFDWFCMNCLEDVDLN